MDKIGDLLNRITTANPNARAVIVPNSKYKREILKVLYEEGWISGITEKKPGFMVRGSKGLPKRSSDCMENSAGNELKTEFMQVLPEMSLGSFEDTGKSTLVKDLVVFLKRPYVDASNNTWTNINLKISRISKPGRRIYYTAKENKTLISKVTNIASTLIISTNKGIMTVNKAAELNLGGELLFKISA